MTNSTSFNNDDTNDSYHNRSISNIYNDPFNKAYTEKKSPYQREHKKIGTYLALNKRLDEITTEIGKQKQEEDRKRKLQKSAPFCNISRKQREHIENMGRISPPVGRYSPNYELIDRIKPPHKITQAQLLEPYCVAPSIYRRSISPEKRAQTHEGSQNKDLAEVSMDKRSLEKANTSLMHRSFMEKRESSPNCVKYQQEVTRTHTMHSENPNENKRFEHVQSTLFEKQPNRPDFLKGFLNPNEERFEINIHREFMHKANRKRHLSSIDMKRIVGRSELFTKEPTPDYNANLPLNKTKRNIVAFDKIVDRETANQQVFIYPPLLKNANRHRVHLIA